MSVPQNQGQAASQGQTQNPGSAGAVGTSAAGQGGVSKQEGSLLEGGADASNAGDGVADSSGDESSLLDASGDDANGAAAGDKAQSGNDANSDAKAAQGAPEQYADFTLPEGVSVDAPALDEFKGIAKAANLSQEQAQKLVDLQIKNIKAQAEAIQAQWKQTVEDWKQETIQSLGPEYKKQLGLAAKARDRFGTPELRQVLNETGLANNKEVIGLFVRLGKLISEDAFVEGKSMGTGPKDAASVLYPSQGINK